MTAVADLMRELISRGMDAAEAAALVACAGVEMSAAGPSKAAARTRKWRAKRASQTVTERHAVTVPKPEHSASPNVTNRHGDVTGDGDHISILSSASENEESPKEVKKIEAPREKRASRIPVDWQLEQRHIDYAISKGVARERIPDLGEKFKNHWLSASGKGSVSPDWFLKWCTWVMNDVEWNGAKNGAKSHGHRTAQGAGSTGQDAIIAGLGRIADRVRERGDAERREREMADGDDAARSDDARLL
jgi:hypothetical protein